VFVRELPDHVRDDAGLGDAFLAIDMSGAIRHAAMIPSSAMKFSLLFVVVALSALGCSKSSVPPGKHYDAAPPMTIDKAKHYSATMVTSKGTIALSLDAAAAPVTVNNFVFLARNGFYDGLKFHRVEPNFVIQGGDPEGTGEGGPGYTIPDEKSGLIHGDGALAMAKTSAPNSAGSQFYITLGPQPSLDGNYTVFGQVTAGKEVTRAIVVGDTITKVTIEEK
jgi:peptidyl-prolyl cis-trans isomerase B (cyclophilin B)